MPEPERIQARLQALWEVARGPDGGADRPAYSAAEARAMELVAGWARQAGLTPGLDRWGNLWALPGGDGPVVTSGSHVDTVPDGGRYDGALGTVLGLELVHDRTDASTPPGVLICVAEEAPRFGAGTLGSRALAGKLAESALAELTDAHGVSAVQAREDYFRRLSSLPRIDPPLKRLRAHAEVHVAQRRALRTLGVVRHVATPRRYEVQITGRAGHSGEVAMHERRDALAAAAEMILAVEAAVSAEPEETVATVGVIDVSPGAVSVIPGRARLLIDVRAIASQSLQRVTTTIQERVVGIAADRDVEAELRLVRGGEPVEMDPGLAIRALNAAAALGVEAVGTWSGAGHDAQHLAALIPTLLVFVPLHGGESHTPQEGADLDEILAAARLVTSALA